MKKIMIFLFSVMLTMNGITLFAQAEAPKQFTATPIGISLACHLSWVNPAATVAGAPLTHINKMVLERNGEIIKEFANPAVGAPMNFTDPAVPATNTYHYVLYAVTNEKGLESELYTDIGDGCYFRFVMRNIGYGSGGWYGSYINITVNEVDYCTVTLQGTYFAEKTIFIPSGALTFTWVSVGAHDAICYFNIYNPLDELLFSIEQIYDIGKFLEYENKCHENNQECDPATNFVISINNSTVELTWEGIADSYTIMRNETVIKEVSETHYVDEDVEYGKFYSYCIFANYNDGCVSPPICDDIRFLNVIDYKDNITIYPNPANDELKIENGELKIENVEIFDVYGRKIFNFQLSTFNSIDVSGLHSGIYFVKITTEQGVTTKKIIINH